MSPKAYIAIAAVLALACIFGGGAAVGWGLRAAHDASSVAGAHGDFATCKATADAQTGVLAKVATNTKAEQARADALQQQAAGILKARPAAMQKIEQRGRDAAIGIREQGHEDVDSAALARLPVPPALAWRLWPGEAASAGAPASH